MGNNSVAFAIDNETLLDILRRAASQERTVVEFQTREVGGERRLDTAIEITEHVENLEKQLDTD